MAAAVLCIVGLFVFRMARQLVVIGLHTAGVEDVEMLAENEMQTVQIAITSSGFGQRLREALERNGSERVRFVEKPDLQQDGVVVVDQRNFERISCPLRKPERVVLITRNESELIDRAWGAGILSVVLETDPLDNVLLAIQSAAFRVGAIHPVLCQAPLSRRTPRVRDGN
jgi:hypothetical protein